MYIKSNWFKKHLNWSAVLSWLAAYPIHLVTFILTGLIAMLFAPDIDEQALDLLADYVSLTVVLTWVLLTSSWVLKRKDRSLWNLLWLSIPFGWIPFLCLDNQSEEAKKEKAKKHETSVNLFLQKDPATLSQSERVLWDIFKRTRAEREKESKDKKSED